MERDECLRVLGLSGWPTQNEVDTARQKLARQHHPDVGGDNYTMALINEAARALSRPTTIEHATTTPVGQPIVDAQELDEGPSLFQSILFFVGIPVATIALVMALGNIVFL